MTAPAAFPAPSARVLRLFSRSVATGLRAYREEARLELADGSVAVPTVKAALEIVRFESEHGLGISTALTENVRVSPAGAVLSRDSNFVISR